MSVVVNGIVIGNNLSQNALFYNDFTSFPIIGLVNVLYIDEATSFIYLWNGTAYVTTSNSQGIIFFNNLAVRPVVGIVDKLYIDKQTSINYIWNGTIYITAAGGGGSGDALIANPLSQFAVTTSAQLASVISNETGSGNLVFGTSPTLIAPSLGTPTTLVGTNITGTASGLTAGNVTTNANLTGVITSVGNATAIADTALSIGKTNGLQTALDLKYNANNPSGFETPAQLNTRDTNNRSRSNHTGTQAAGTITGLAAVATSGNKTDVGLGNVPNTDFTAAVALNTAKNSYPTGDSTKVNHISVTQTVDLDIIESDTVINNAKVGITAGQASDIMSNNVKVSNATHIGDVTGATALTITNNIVTNIKLEQVPTKTFKGRTSALTGNVEDLTVAEVKTDLAINLVDNTTDAGKPVSTAQQTALNLKANLASPTFTGTPTLPTGSIAVTQTAGNNTTALATTAFVTTADALKANIASPTFTGIPAAPTATLGTNTTQLATTAFVTAANPPKTVGQTWGGGVVFYIYNNGQNGLITTVGNQSTGVKWRPGTTDYVSGAVATGVGAGIRNTNIIMSPGSGNLDGNVYAAGLCANVSVVMDGVTYADWYLPSRHELALIWDARASLSNLAASFYWSSTENDATSAWVHHLTTGQVATELKNTSYVDVRAIRAF